MLWVCWAACGWGTPPSHTGMQMVGALLHCRRARGQCRLLTSVALLSERSCMNSRMLGRHAKACATRAGLVSVLATSFLALAGLKALWHLAGLPAQCGLFC